MKCLNTGYKLYTPSACWCHFIQALYDVELCEVASEAMSHLQNKTSCDISVCVTMPDTGELVV